MLEVYSKYVIHILRKRQKDDHEEDLLVSFIKGKLIKEDKYKE